MCKRTHSSPCPHTSPRFQHAAGPEGMPHIPLHTRLAIGVIPPWRRALLQCHLFHLLTVLSSRLDPCCCLNRCSQSISFL